MSLLLLHLSHFLGYYENLHILVPSATELTILAVVVAIRIILSWSLSKEIDRHSPYVQDNDDKTSPSTTKQVSNTE